jgi:hypothetical protein
MASQEGIGRIYTCLCHRANGQAVCVDVKLPGTTEGLSQTSVSYYSCMSMTEFWVHASGAYDDSTGDFHPRDRKGRGVEFQKSSIRARPARSIPFLLILHRAYDTVVNGRPARTLYVSRETRKEEGRKG